MRNPLRLLYNWTMTQAQRPAAEPWLYFIAFIESLFFPIPPDVMLVPIVLARRQHWLRIATLCTLVSVLGGALGFAIGFWVFETYGQAILSFLHLADAFESFKSLYNRFAALAVFAGAASPIPYKVVALASGSVQMSFTVFVIVSLAARAMRFFMVAFFLNVYGDNARRWIERWFDRLSIIVLLLLVFGVTFLMLYS